MVAGAGRGWWEWGGGHRPPLFVCPTSPPPPHPRAPAFRLSPRGLRVRLCVRVSVCMDEFGRRCMVAVAAWGRACGRQRPGGGAVRAYIQGLQGHPTAPSLREMDGAIVGAQHGQSMEGKRADARDCGRLPPHRRTQTERLRLAQRIAALLAASPQRVTTVGNEGNDRVLVAIQGHWLQHACCAWQGTWVRRMPTRPRGGIARTIRAPTDCGLTHITHGSQRTHTYGRSQVRARMHAHTERK
jgi:hypothetical protein